MPVRRLRVGRAERDAEATRENRRQESLRLRGEQDDDRAGRWFFERFEKGVAGFFVQAIGVDDDADFDAGGGGFEIGGAFELANLFDEDPATL